MTPVSRTWLRYHYADACHVAVLEDVDAQLVSCGQRNPDRRHQGSSKVASSISGTIRQGTICVPLRRDSAIVTAWLHVDFRRILLPVGPCGSSLRRRAFYWGRHDLAGNSGLLPALVWPHQKLAGQVGRSGRFMRAASRQSRTSAPAQIRMSSTTANARSSAPSALSAPVQ